MLIGTHRTRSKPDWDAKPYCQCWTKRAPVPWKQLSACTCGEENNVSEWRWEAPALNGTSSVVVSEDQKQVTFHPFYSSGTAAVRGDTPLERDHHYYWEVKMLTDTYGTDIMIGLGTDKVNIADSQFKFTSLLGSDAESYGLSYRGTVRHDATAAKDSAGFCRGSIVGVRVDMWRGTLEFFLNRRPQGIAFHNLRRHPTLYPMLCSTAAQSSMRLTYAASWRASLLVEAAKTLAASVGANARQSLPPGLWFAKKSQFWLTLPTDGCAQEEEDDEVIEKVVPEEMEVDTVQVAKSLLNEVLPSPYMNGFYTDSIDPDYRVVVWE